MLGILVTMVDSRTLHSRGIYETIKHELPYHVFETPIPMSVKAKEAPAHGQSVLSHATNSEVAKAYRKVAEEIEAEIEGTITKGAEEGVRVA